MSQWVEISFDCLPLRTVGRMDIPIDASPKYRALCERIKHAIDTHGSHNTFYLYNAKCVYHLTNRPDYGMLEFRFDGTVFTDADDLKSDRCELYVELVRETCDWLTEPIVQWFHDSVRHSVCTEFDRYIEAGDLARTRERIEKLRAANDEAGGFVGMYL
ncbi:MAG TPA: hypothetical protein VL096_03110 [Pirellulaceae bacterium]|nr:hypothetical protein [Pirellulaceae bacterium]